MYTRYNPHEKKVCSEKVIFFNTWDELKYYVITYAGGVADVETKNKIDTLFSKLFTNDLLISYIDKDARKYEQKISVSYNNPLYKVEGDIYAELIEPHLQHKHIILVSAVLVNLTYKTLDFYIQDLDYYQTEEISVNISSYTRKFFIDLALNEV